MSASARRAIQRFGATSGYWYVALLLLGWVAVAGFVPPHRPSAGAEEIAAVYQGNVTRIQLGMIIVMIGAAMCAPFTAILAQYISRIEGGPGVLTYSIVLGGIGTIVLTFYPAIFWLVAAYRPDRSPDVILMLNDWAWLQLIGGATIFWPLPLGMAVAALCDRSANPVFPRWSGWTSIWLFLMILPDQLLFFFKTGPFAWNGLFGFWLPLSAFAGWFVLASWLMLAAMKRGYFADAEPEALAASASPISNSYATVR
ncbi:hypothetical protein [Sphingobium herbicidovorans]|nr:hypothetical protein [Sphingobium herbicidovorans]